MTSPGDAAIVPGVEKIAIIRANGIGDLVFSLPALQALRAAYPQAEITLLGLPWHVGFVPGRTPVDRVVVLPRIEGVGTNRPPFDDEDEVDLFIEEMRRERFDLVLQMHGGGRYSNPFARRLGARVTAGFRSFDADPLDHTVPYVYYHNEYLRYLELVSLVGAHPTDLEPRLTVLPEDLAEARALAPDGPFAVVNPGAGAPARRWPLDRFAAVADWLAGRGFQVVITGSAGDATDAAEIAGSMASPARNIAGSTSLGGLLGVMSQATIVLSNDSGPLHLATAAGTPTVGIYWCVNLVNSMPWNRSRDRPVTSWTTHCTLCGQDATTDILPTIRVDTCDHENGSFVDAIEVWQVTQALDWLLRDLRDAHVVAALTS